MSKKDYPELEGKEITYYYDEYPSYQGIVIGCNYDIGITIINKYDKNHYLFCTRGPSSLNWKNTDPFLKPAYRVSFYNKIAMIKHGHFYPWKDEIIIKKYRDDRYVDFTVPVASPTEPSAETCAFL